MKLTLKPVQCHVLVRLATARQMSFNHLVKSSMPDREMDADQRIHWDTEIRLQIELLALYGAIRIEEANGIRMCHAPAFVLAWLPGHLERVGQKKYRPSIVMPLIAATVVAVATTACSHFPEITQSTPAPVVAPYNAAGTPPPERMEQFYNPKTNSMVYRFCVGSECPGPTPKMPKQTMAVVNEIDMTGHVSPVDQKVSPTPFAEKTITSSVRDTPNPVRVQPARTAQNDKAAAAVAAQLDQQRRAILEASGAAQAPTVPPTAPKTSGRSLQDAGVPVFNRPTPQPSPTAPGAVRKDKSPVQDMLPSTGTRVPTAPQASVATPTAPQLAKLKVGTEGTPGVGGTGYREMVTETPVSSTVAATGNTPEAVLLGWADLWSTKNADGYFKLYAKDFWPTYGENKTFAAFEQQRRAIMSRNSAIKVRVEVVKIEEKDGKASIRFWQSYESKSFKSRVLKSIELAKVEGDWKIRRERLINIPQNPIA